MARLAQWRLEQLIFLNESAAHERTADRRYGWSPRGFPCRIRNPCKRSKRWSILPALSVDGYIAVDIFQGSYTAARFNEFVRLQVLPACQSGSVVVMNNASFHRNPELKELCLAAGIDLAFLPPYSPEFNPIEEIFHTLKEWIRRHQEEAC